MLSFCPPPFFQNCSSTGLLLPEITNNTTNNEWYNIYLWSVFILIDKFIVFCIYKIKIKIIYIFISVFQLTFYRKMFACKHETSIGNCYIILYIKIRLGCHIFANRASAIDSTNFRKQKGTSPSTILYIT